MTEAVETGVLAEDRLARYLRLCAELAELSEAREASQRKAQAAGGTGKKPIKRCAASATRRVSWRL